MSKAEQGRDLAMRVLKQTDIIGCGSRYRRFDTGEKLPAFGGWEALFRLQQSGLCRRLKQPEIQYLPNGIEYYDRWTITPEGRDYRDDA